MTEQPPVEDLNDPRHIYQARAAHAARQAERDFEREVEAAMSTAPPRIGTILRRALSREATSASIARQDASGHMPLAVCLDGQVVGLIPENADSTSPEGIAALRGAAAAARGIPAERFEILQVCHLHPGSSAVDCLDCEPA